MPARKSFPKVEEIDYYDDDDEEKTFDSEEDTKLPAPRLIGNGDDAAVYSEDDDVEMTDSAETTTQTPVRPFVPHKSILQQACSAGATTQETTGRRASTKRTLVPVRVQLQVEFEEWEVQNSDDDDDDEEESKPSKQGKRVKFAPSNEQGLTHYFRNLSLDGRK